MKIRHCTSHLQLISVWREQSKVKPLFLCLSTFAGMSALKWIGLWGWRPGVELEPLNCSHSGLTSIAPLTMTLKWRRWRKAVFQMCTRPTDDALKTSAWSSFLPKRHWANDLFAPPCQFEVLDDARHDERWAPGRLTKKSRVDLSKWLVYSE